MKTQSLLFACLFIATICGCSKKDAVSDTPVLTLQTNAVTEITQISALSGGTISSEGASPVTQKGICWSTSPAPTINNDKTADGAGTGSFTSVLPGLSANTLYYVRAYATNSKDTAYGAQVSFTTAALTIAGKGVTDIDGNTYKTVILGGKEWMAENLRTTKYQNGDVIENITVQKAWEKVITGAWCHYNNTAGYDNTYGKLYNWYAAKDPRNISPVGWHVPSAGEYKVLSAYLGGDNLSGGLLKQTGVSDWASPNTGATNASGFTALQGGRRNSAFYNFGTHGFLWTADGNSFGSYIFLRNNNAEIVFNSTGKTEGMSIRCVKD